MLRRLAKDKYQWMPPCHEDAPGPVIGRKAAEKALKDRGCPPDVLKRIMSESTPGFVMT